MKNTSFIAFLILLSSLCLAQTVPLRWSAELGDARPARFTLVHGDTVELAADLFAEGRPYLPATADASLLWQTNGMGALWWEVPAFVASNRVSATWTPAMDTGAASYLAHFRVGSSTGSVFRAYARLAMQHGPGDPPNALPLPVPFIDFAKVAVTNEPWSSSGLTTNDVRAIVADATNGVLRVVDGEVTLPGGIDITGGSVTIVEGGLRVNESVFAAAIDVAEHTLYSDSSTIYYGDPEQTYDAACELAVKGDIPNLDYYDGAIDATAIAVEGVPVATQDDIARTPVSSVSSVRYASGVLTLTVPASATLSANLADWPDGAAVFSRMSAAGPYSVSSSLKLLGYGQWPTNSAVVVFVRDGSRVLANVLEGN